MIDNKYKIGQEVALRISGELTLGKVMGIGLGEDDNLIYKVRVSRNSYAGITVIRRCEYFHVYEEAIKKPKHMSQENKVYDNIKTKALIKQELGVDDLPNIIILKTEIEDSETRLHYTLKGEFKTRVVVSRCHPDDEFSETKGLMACVIKSNIEALKIHLERI